MIFESKISVKLAEYLLKIKAVKLEPNNPFTWSSGWKSPIYCDNRVTLSYPEIRKFIAQNLAEIVKKKFPEAQSLCGVATAGIAIGGLVADNLELPYSYCRPKPKDHGMKNQLEGRIEAGSNVVVVEDLISTGGSSLLVVNYLREAGYNVVGMISIFNYGFDVASKNFNQANCPFFSLSNYEALLPQAVAQNYIKQEDLPLLEAWRNDPANWG
ncbi:MAG: orotate phosphoribosyltransferase [Flavobacteriales bacterium]|nr:orotate phosphoribosyltransferase [Flavobacteriales bacterium]